ncbi:PRC-barrel domain containing protein [Haloprofundus salinisoli]|uniref:PRC-barrel domain containing protein n=1 Tax=Haloprofundus salinisoli TaxID=2876193 RepID=UPI001CC9EFE9|nr:PRC-barrel domain containing protein [Haloprofundus salinisoli]
MSTDLTDDDEGKPLLDGSGEHVGFVADVEDGTAHVDPDRDLDDELKQRLGWGPSESETYSLRHDAIDRVTEEVIRLRADYGGE